MVSSFFLAATKFFSATANYGLPCLMGHILLELLRRNIRAAGCEQKSHLIPAAVIAIEADLFRTAENFLARFSRPCDAGSQR
jgi:hypothetical protein